MAKRVCQDNLKWASQYQSEASPIVPTSWRQMKLKLTTNRVEVVMKILN
jgi:hypothetical protein